MWNKKRYETVRKNCSASLEKEIETYEYWLQCYIDYMYDEDYESAMAIHEVFEKEHEIPIILV
jgi:hypothetical protein